MQVDQILMMLKPRLTIIVVLFVAVVGFVVATSRPFQAFCCAKEWRRYPQPNGPHAIVVYRLPQWFALPGSGSDAPAVVRLETGNGEVLESTEVELLLSVGVPEWRNGRVEIKLIADWLVPSPSD